MAMSNAERQARHRARRKSAAARVADRYEDLGLVEERIEAGVSALWSAVERDGLAKGNAESCDLFRKNFFLTTHDEREGIVSLYRELMSDRDFREVETAVRLMKELSIIAGRSGG